MALSEKEIGLLLQFQSAKFEYDIRSSEGVLTEKSREAYASAKENLKTITDPHVAKLVRKMNQPWLVREEKDATGKVISRDHDPARSDEIMLAEKELYELTYKYGDTSPSASDLKQ